MPDQATIPPLPGGFTEIPPPSDSSTVPPLPSGFKELTPPSGATGIVPIRGFSNLSYSGRVGEGQAHSALLDEINGIASQNGLKLGISSAQRTLEHNLAVSQSGNRSRHIPGNAVDISTINGLPVTTPQGKAWGDWLATKLQESGYSFGEHGTNKGYLWQTNIGGNHFNHLHVSLPQGFQATPGNYHAGGAAGYAADLVENAEKWTPPLPAGFKEMTPPQGSQIGGAAGTVAGAIAQPVVAAAKASMQPQTQPAAPQPSVQQFDPQALATIRQKYLQPGDQSAPAQLAQALAMHTTDPKLQALNAAQLRKMAPITQHAVLMRAAELAQEAQGVPQMYAPQTNQQPPSLPVRALAAAGAGMETLAAPVKYAQYTAEQALGTKPILPGDIAEQQRLAKMTPYQRMMALRDQPLRNLGRPESEQYAQKRTANDNVVGRGLEHIGGALSEMAINPITYAAGGLGGAAEKVGESAANVGRIAELAKMYAPDSAVAARMGAKAAAAQNVAKALQAGHIAAQAGFTGQQVIQAVQESPNAWQDPIGFLFNAGMATLGVLGMRSALRGAKGESGAVQEPQTGTVLQRQPQETGIAGGQRPGVESGQQGGETPAQGQVQQAEGQAAKESQPQGVVQVEGEKIPGAVSRQTGVGTVGGTAPGTEYPVAVPPGGKYIGYAGEGMHEVEGPNGMRYQVAEKPTEPALPTADQLRVTLAQRLASEAAARESAGAPAGNMAEQGTGPGAFIEHNAYPIERIQVNKDIPQFKEGADPRTGVVPSDKLEGGYERLGTGPIVVWEKNDGTSEVITGRHRLDLAKRNGETTIPVQVVREANGFTKDMAMIFDAEANIRDGKGSTKDYARYFAATSDKFDEGQARQRGLLSATKGRAGFDLGRNAADDVRALYLRDRITEQQALAIARSAPGEADLQRVGIRYALDGRDPEFIGNVLQAVKSAPKAKGNVNLFGEDDSAMQAAEAQAKRATEITRDIRDRISSASGAAKRPGLAKELGIDVNDPQAVAAEVARLRGELQRWQRWAVHPDLVQRTLGAPEPTRATLQVPGTEAVTPRQTKIAENEAVVQAARERIAKRGGVKGSQAGATLGPEDFHDLLLITEKWIENSGLKFAEWSSDIVKEFGEAVKPHLQAIWDAAQEVRARTKAQESEQKPTEVTGPTSSVANAPEGASGGVVETQPSGEEHYSNRQPRDEEGKFNGPPEPASETGIAQRVHDVRAAEGKIGTITPGTGTTPEEMIQHGRDLIKSGIDPVVHLAQMEAQANHAVSGDDIALLRAHFEELGKATNKAEDALRSAPNDPKAKAAYDAAWNAETGWAKRIKPFQTEWHRIGMAQQGSTEIDTGTFSGIRRAFTERVGRDMTPAEEKQAQAHSEAVKTLSDRVKALEDKLNDSLKAEGARQAARPSKPTRSGEPRKPLPTDAEGLAQHFAKRKADGSLYNAAITRSREAGAVRVSNKPQFTQQEIQSIWKYAKENYLDKYDVKTRRPVDFGEMVDGVSRDLGLDREEVLHALASNKSARVITDAMYREMSNRREAINRAKRFVEDANVPGVSRFLSTVNNLPRAALTFGHGTALMATHAGENIFRPSSWMNYWPNFFRQWKIMYGPNGKALHENLMQQMERHPDYTLKVRSGLAIDPNTTYDSVQDYTKLLGKFGGVIGEIGKRSDRAIDTLKLFRSAEFDRLWAQQPVHLKTQDMAQFIAQLVNHSTGKGSLGHGPMADIATKTMFAPSLFASRWARTIGDPTQVTKILAKGRNATPEESAFVRLYARRAAELTTTLVAALGANYGLQAATGQQDKVNLTNPTAADWMRFKWNGKTFDPTGNMLAPIHLMARLLNDGIKSDPSSFGAHGYDYARSQSAPIVGLGLDVLFRKDFMGRPLPFASPAMKAKGAAHGKPAYGWGEYAWTHAPLPLSGAMKEYYDTLRHSGMEASQSDAIMAAIRTLAVEQTGMKQGVTPKRPAAANLYK